MSKRNSSHPNARAKDANPIVMSDRLRQVTTLALMKGVVIVEAFGSFTEAEKCGLFDHAPEIVRQMLRNVVPKELGGRADTPELREIWSKMRGDTLQLPAMMRNVQQYRFWIATGVISREKPGDPLMNEYYVEQAEPGAGRLAEMLINARSPHY